MEENLLKYFLGQGEPTTEEIMPINVSSGQITTTTLPNYKTLISNDGNYFIKYGGVINTGFYKAIEVYSIDSLTTEEPVYVFDEYLIEGVTPAIRNLKQDEDGRFYGIAVAPDLSKEYLVLFNNFLQDGYIEVRKFYSNTTMGLTDNYTFNQVIKKNGSAQYFILNETNLKIYSYKIDITSGNELKTYSYTDTGTIGTDLTFVNNIYCIKDNFILMNLSKNDSNQYQCKKLVINTTAEEESYTLSPIYTNSASSVLVLSITDYNYIIPYLDSSNNFNFVRVNMNGEISIFNTSISLNSSEIKSVTFSENYCVIATNTNLIQLYYNPNDVNSLIEFSNISFSNYFQNAQVLKKFNLIVIMGAQGNGIVYAKNIYSVGYSSEPYYNNNFMIPQYLNLYANSNDNTSVIFSRDASNRFLAGNQFTTTFNIPNYMLNTNQINREDVIGQTNLTIESDTTQYIKNRFESLYLNYIYNMYVTDNTNGNNLSNLAGANRVADSVWNRLDHQDSPLAKVRVTYEDGQQEILNLNITNVSSSVHTFEYEVTGNINKIEYLSNDEQTVYATYRCNLTGTNTISQTISVEEG